MRPRHVAGGRAAIVSLIHWSSSCKKAVCTSGLPSLYSTGTSIQGSGRDTFSVAPKDFREHTTAVEIAQLGLSCADHADERVTGFVMTPDHLNWDVTGRSHSLRCSVVL